ncbi:MAG: GNAT family N-acetyltransferase [Candidatus Thorarchaeota archaeon]
MTLIIEKKNNIDDWEALLREYLTDMRKITDEEILNKNIDHLKTALKENKRIALIALVNNTPIGFITGNLEGEVLEGVAVYIKPESYPENCGYQLVNALTEYGFQNNAKYFRYTFSLPHNLESSFEEHLKKNGFMLFPRAQMLLKLSADGNQNITLPEGYFFEPFSVEKTDQIFDVMVAANPIGHSDSYIYPEMRSSKWSEQIFSGFSNNFHALDLDLNQQVSYNNKIVGISFVFANNPETSFIAEICIHPEYQGKGLGKALMKKIIQESSRKGFKQLGLAVTVDNSGAYSLYQKLGFQTTKDLLAIVKHK